RPNIQTELHVLLVRAVLVGVVQQTVVIQSEVQLQFGQGFGWWWLHRHAALGLAGGGGGERLTGDAAAVKRPFTLALPKAEGALGPSGVITPDGAGAALSASTRSHSARRFVALASVRLAQMPQAAATPESAASAGALPRQATQWRWRSPLTLACPQSGIAWTSCF